MGLNPFIYSMGDNSFLLPHFKVHTRSTYSIHCCIYCWLAYNNRNKKRQIVIDNAKTNFTQVRHYYMVGNLLYVNKTGIYNKLNFFKTLKIWDHFIPHKNYSLVPKGPD